MTTIQQPIHNINNLQPQIPHPLPLAQQRQVPQIHLTKQTRRADARLAHAVPVGGVHLRLEQLEDEREEDLAEDGGPFAVVCGCELRREQRALQGGKREVTNVAARIGTLRCESLKDGKPVGRPGCFSQFRYSYLMRMAVWARTTYLRWFPGDSGSSNAGTSRSYCISY